MSLAVRWKRIRQWLASRWALYENRKRLGIVAIWLIFSFIISVAGWGLLERKFQPLIMLCAASEAQNAALCAAGEAVEAAMLDAGATYQDIITLEHNADGTVTACRTDTVMVNHIRAAVVDRLNAYFMSEGADITFPIGNIFGGGVFYARGPRISFRMMPVGRMECVYQSAYEACGINQTRHQLTMDLTIRISVLGAGSSEEIEVSGQFPIAETIIIGYVPEHYAGMDFGN